MALTAPYLLSPISYLLSPISYLLSPISYLLSPNRLRFTKVPAFSLLHLRASSSPSRVSFLRAYPPPAETSLFSLS